MTVLLFSLVDKSLIVKKVGKLKEEKMKEVLELVKKILGI